MTHRLPQRPYQVDLRVDASPTDFRDMRGWLDEYAPPVPRNRAAVLAKFICCTLCSNAQWDGVYIGDKIGSIRVLT